MFRISRLALSAAFTLGVLALSPIRAHADNSVLYVGDYLGNRVLRFDGDTGAPILPEPFINGGYEGIVGLDNSLIVAHLNQTYDIVLGRFDRFTGAFQGDIANGFASVGGFDLSKDGQYLYVPDYIAGRLSRIRVSDGAVVNQIDLPLAHDVTVGPDGRVYLSAYNLGVGVRVFNADLTNEQTFIANGDNGLDAAAGITFGKDGNFYAVENKYQGEPGSLFEYSPTGQYIDSVTSPILQFGFGVDQGPDGRFYVASIGSLIDPNYVNCIAAVDFGNHTATPFIVVDANNHLIGPKYLKFSDNFVNTVPEPGAVAFGILAGGSVLGLIARKRKA